MPSSSVRTDHYHPLTGLRSYHIRALYFGYSPPPILDRLIEDDQKIHQQRLLV